MVRAVDNRKGLFGHYERTVGCGKRAEHHAFFIGKPAEIVGFGQFKAHAE